MTTLAGPSGATPPERTLRVRVLRIARSGPHLTTLQIAHHAGCSTRNVTGHLAATGTMCPGRGRRRRSLTIRRDTARRSPHPGLLARLAFDPDTGARVSAAMNPSCPTAVLARVVHDDFANYGAARNRNATPRLLTRLASGWHPSVRAAVAGNTNCPPALLEHLRDDPDEGVARRAQGRLARRQRPQAPTAGPGR